MGKIIAIGNRVIALVNVSQTCPHLSVAHLKEEMSSLVVFQKQLLLKIPTYILQTSFTTTLPRKKPGKGTTYLQVLDEK